MKPLDFRLYAITDRWLVSDLTEFAERAQRQGLRAVRLREKDMEPHDSLSLARELRSVLTRSKLFVSAPEDAKKIVSVTAGFATTVTADGIHLPERAIGNEWTPERLRVPLPHLLCAVSVHSMESAQRAEAWGADFLSFGPIFETPSKRAMGFGPQGLNALNVVVRSVQVPVLAIGGITPAGAKLCIEEGAWGVAVIRDLLVAPNLEERLSEYKEVLGTL